MSFSAAAKVYPSTSKSERVQNSAFQDGEEFFFS